jgi:hypothetical protein
VAARFRGAVILAVLLCACGGEGEDRAPEPGRLAPAVPLPADPRGEAAGAIDFGRVEVGRHAVATVYLENPGDEPVLLPPPPPVGPFFATVPAGGLAVAPGERAPLSLTFVPRAAGSAEALLELQAGETPLSLRLLGEGVAGGACVLAVAPLLFGEVPAGGEVERRAELRNAGDAACVLADVSVSGEGFSLGEGLFRGVTLLPGGAPLPIPVRFRPAEALSYRGVLRIDAGPASAEVELAGTGV